MLPPLASLASPSDTTGYAAWGMSATDMGSLRSGPLSPAMLAGPQQQHQQQQQQQHQTLAGFDASSFGRTGLTPSTGLTPLVGGPVSFPPPSPNTAAFLAMVSNSTTAANLASTTAATITPNTLSAITGVLNNTAMPQSYQTFAPQRQDYPSAAAQAQSDVAGQVNGLFLLSQAHQELAKREEAQQRASTSAEPSMNPQAADPPSQPRRAAKRKSTDAQAPAPMTSSATRNGNKKARTAAPPASKPKRGKRADSLMMSDDDEDLDDDESDDGMSPTSLNGTSATKTPKKPETEEEKRRNFLERNRQGVFRFTSSADRSLIACRFSQPP